LNPASFIIDSSARPHYGVEGDIFNKIGLPSKRGANADLKVSHTGKFHGKITSVGPKG